MCHQCQTKLCFVNFNPHAGFYVSCKLFLCCDLFIILLNDDLNILEALEEVKYFLFLVKSCSTKTAYFIGVLLGKSKILEPENTLIVFKGTQLFLSMDFIAGWN